MAPTVLLGIEIGGTKLQLGLGDGLGNLTVLERRRIEPAHGAAGILAQISEGFGSILSQGEVNRTHIRAAGVGFGGPIDFERNRIERSFQVEGWDNFPLPAWISEHLGLNTWPWAMTPMPPAWRRRVSGPALVALPLCT